MTPGGSTPPGVRFDKPVGADYNDAPRVLWPTG